MDKNQFNYCQCCNFHNIFIVWVIGLNVPYRPQIIIICNLQSSTQNKSPVQGEKLSMECKLQTWHH